MLAADVAAAPVVALMGIGVLVAILGHLAGSRRTVVTGIALIFLATLFMVLGALVAYQGDEVDPRKPSDPRDSGF